MAYETDNLLYGRTSNPWDLSVLRADQVAAKLRRLRRVCRREGWGATAEARCASRHISAASARLKPTPGRVPGRGHHPPNIGPFSTLGAIGPMGRTVADVSLLFKLLAGQDALDPASAPVPLRPSLDGGREVDPDRMVRGRRPHTGDRGDTRRGAGRQRASWSGRASMCDHSARHGWKPRASCGGSSSCSAERCSTLQSFADVKRS